MGAVSEFWIRETEFYSWGMFFTIAGLALSLLAIVWHFAFAISRQSRKEMLLGIMATALFWHVFIYLLIFTGLIRIVPNLYNKGIPFYYLIAPCAYFFVLFSLFPRVRWSRYWWLHLIPFVLGAIDMIPYLVASAQEKKALLELIVYNMQMGVQHGYGYVDQKWHYIGKFLLAFIYLIAQWRLLYLHDDDLSPISVSAKRNIIGFNIVYSLQLLLQGGMVLSLLFNRTHSSFMMQDMDQLRWVSLVYLLFSCWLFQHACRLSMRSRYPDHSNHSKINI